MKIFSTFIAGATLAITSATLCLAAGDVKSAKDVDFSFEGPFGKFDKAQLQRGFQVYNEVCSACHSLNYVSYRELSEPDGTAFTEAEVKAIAAEKEVTDGPNTEGEMFQRAAMPSDKFVPPYPNKETAIAMNGAYPPDLSLITKARAGWHGTFRQLFQGMGGTEYVYSVLTGYQDPPKGATGPEGKSYNPYFVAGPWITMAAPLSDDAVTYTDGTAATVDQMAKDVSAFLAWTAEPRMVERKQLGLRVMVFLSIFSILLYFSYKTLWRNVKK
ncbi:MAG: ubiquinol-cytochrome c reductase cytochrome b/c1 subunit [Alphaproteobacteria bacterium]|jgi:ubiquinol-cytochrome c reductase cytochrome b/c1 subunit